MKDFFSPEVQKFESENHSQLGKDWLNGAPYSSYRQYVCVMYEESLKKGDVEARPMYTPEFIDQLPRNGVFVYGSNQYARHGAGSAKMASQNFGAQYHDAPMGLCGSSYGIITKSFNDIPVTLKFIDLQIQTLYEFAKLRPDLTFYVTKIGTALAGFSLLEIRALFFNKIKPDNIILPQEFTRLI